MSQNGTTDNGKAPAQEPRAPAPRDRLVNVQPARLDELQPRYAQQIQHEADNPDAHGWYSGFSK